MATIGSLSPSLEDYIEVIFDLLREKGVARVRDVSHRKSVKMASVNNALKRLEREEMITHQSYKGICLTDKGMKLAKKLEKRHTVIKRFLEDVLNIRSEIADSDACAIEHHVHKETIDGLVKFINRGVMTPRSEKQNDAH